jgi:DNA polymerase-3 subunit alpha
MSYVGEAKNTQQSSLFGGEEFKPRLPDTDEWSEMEKLNREKTIVGFYLSSHPLDGIDLPEVTASSEFEEIADTKEILISAVITSIQKRVSKSGNRFAFVQLSDQYGNFEITVFSDVLEEYDHLLQEGQLVLVNALIRIEEDGYSLSAISFKPLESLLTGGRNNLTLRVHSKLEVDQIHRMLYTVPEGKMTITILLQVEGNQVKLTLPKRYHISVEALKKLKVFETS